MQVFTVNPVLLHNFFSFTGYNPECSKHRKRSIVNLSASTLKEVGQSLFSDLGGSYWKRRHWHSFYYFIILSIAGSIT